MSKVGGASWRWLQRNLLCLVLLLLVLSKLGKSELILKEEQKLAIFSLFSGREVFVWLPTRDSGGVSVSKCFCPVVENKESVLLLSVVVLHRRTRLDYISKKKTT